MIWHSVQDNDNTKPNTRDMMKLKQDFPQFFTRDGEFKFDAFKAFLGQEEIDISKEGYELDFLGKSYAKYQSSVETTTYLSPDTNHNQKEKNKDSDNLYIVGDNLDALKHLLKSYAGKIKCIYIDPPYNTGSDGFVYPDNFQFKAEDLADKLGISDEEAERTLELAGKSTHSAWLTFMYPRLLLARDLLSEDGVIFISIDDNEQSNLKLMCDEIFGEENFLANVIWERAYAPINLMKHFSRSHDFIVGYAKNEALAQNKGIKRDEDANNRYSNPDNDPRGPWQSSDISVGPAIEENIYPIKTPSGRIVEPPAGRSWRLSEKAFSERLQDNRIWFGTDGSGVPRIKRFFSELRKTGITPMTIWKHQEVGHSQDASQALKALFDGQMVFDYPKPVDLIKRTIDLYTDTDDIILDFFSGSGTTAHAVMDLNAEDDSNRKYIMVQLPEKIEEKQSAYKSGYRTIDEIGRERIDRAAKKIKEETEAAIDYGYKLYYLENPGHDTLNQLEDFTPEPTLFADDFVSVFDNEHAKGKENILATWMNEDGYGLSQETEEYQLNQYTASLIDKTLYIIDQGLESADVMELIKRIENNELQVSRVVAYIPSIQFNVLQELKKNIKVLKNADTKLIERF